MQAGVDEFMRSALESVAPGTPLREGLEYVISARTGALIVIGDEDGVAPLCNGGFNVGIPFTAQRLFELAKMDGAIVLDGKCESILRANVHLVPDHKLPTSETGMRHRTAERVSRQTEALVISISQRRDVVSLYKSGAKVVLEPVEVLLAKANQALQTLERYRIRLDQETARLTSAEFDDLVTLSDIAEIVRRFEVVMRVSREVGRYTAALGIEGRLVRMQAEELTASVEENYILLLRDYAVGGGPRKASSMKAAIEDLTAERLLENDVIAGVLGYPASSRIEEHIQGRGHRVMNKIPMLPTTVISRVIERFGTLADLLQASPGQLDDVDGVGTRRAEAITDGLKRVRREAGA